MIFAKLGVTKLKTLVLVGSLSRITTLLHRVVIVKSAARGPGPRPAMVGVVELIARVLHRQRRFLRGGVKE